MFTQHHPDGQRWSKLESRYVGKRITKISDPPLLRGHGKYTDDIKLQGMLHAVFVRSPYAHARIQKIDVSQALLVPGVRAVFTGEDAKDYPISQPIDIEPFLKFGAKPAEVYGLAVDKVRFVGEPVALVVARDKYTAAQASYGVSVEYSPLPAVVDPEKAVEPDAPKVYDHWDGNLFMKTISSKGDVDGAFKEADYTIVDTIRIQRFTGAALEPRSYIGDYEPLTGNLTYYSSTQQPHPLRTILAKTLALPENLVRVIQPQVGGGFGLKIPPFQEEIAVALASIKLTKPVKWTAERKEDLIAGGHARSQTHRFEVAFKKNGIVTGIRDRIIADAGVLFPTPGWGMPIVTSIHIPTVYRVKNVHVELNIVVTNKNALNAYRGFGKECADFLMERVMDMVARKLSMDRADVRFKNFIQPNEFPYELSPSASLDSGNYPGALQKALAIFGYEEWKNAKEQARKEGRLIGLGLAYELTPEGGCLAGSFFLQYDGVTVKVSPTGRVTVLTGITSPGNGQETSIAQIVADELGAKIEDVTIIQGDTELCPYGLGNFSGRSMITGGPASMLAAREIRQKMTKVAANMLEAASEDIDAKEGYFFVKGAPKRRISFESVANTIYRHPYDIASNVEPGLEVTKYFKMPNASNEPDERGYTRIYTTFPNSCHVAAVEVDPETLQVRILRYVVVDDCGKVINPMIVEGQLHGGIAQGIGGTFYEELAYDQNGQLLTTTFMDYPLPTALEVPQIEIGHQETPSPYNPLGAKGVGESGIVGAPPALVSAVEDALEPFNIKILETPIRPSKIWRLLKNARRP